MKVEELAAWTIANRRLYNRYLASIQRANKELTTLSPEEFKDFKTEVDKYDNYGNPKSGVVSG